MHTNNGQGNPELSNLPRKLNIGLSPSRDDFPHTHINDVGLQAVKDTETGEVRRRRVHALACTGNAASALPPCNLTSHMSAVYDKSEA